MLTAPPFSCPGAALSPMAGVTDMPFRLLCREAGAAWSVSEMLSAKGYLYAPEDYRKNIELTRLSPAEGPVGLQLFGHEPRLMAEAAKRLSEAGFAFFDINYGCPAPKIVSGGDGSALLRDIPLAARIAESVVRATPLPVTAKIRSGWARGELVAPEFARALEGAGVRAVTVHPRFREQFYEGQSDWSVIGQVVRTVGIPVIGNGDLRSGADAVRMLKETGCAAVAVGRAAQGNPWIFSEIRAALRGEAYAPPRFSDRIGMALRHLDMEVAFRGEKSAALMMRKHIAWYLTGRRGCVRMRARIVEMGSAEEMREALLQWAETAED